MADSTIPTGLKPDNFDFARLCARLEAMENMLRLLVERELAKPHYEIEQFARIVNKAPFTCREWARLGRIKAEKRSSGRGKYAAWVVSHEELLRYQRHGLLPISRP